MIGYILLLAVDLNGELNLLFFSLKPAWGTGT